MRFHLLGFPHTATNRDYCACAYTSKLVKFIDMMVPRGHTVIDYSNEGFDNRHGIEHVDMLTEPERAAFFGTHDRQRLYDLKWSGSEPYWRIFNERAIEALKPRVKRGDFILTLAGADCHQAIGNAFPNSYSGIAQTAMMVEFGIGYYGTFSRYRVYESNTHREWCMGQYGQKGEDNDSAAVYNYFDLRDFEVPADPGDAIRAIQAAGPYFLFIGRFVESKGLGIACDATEAIGARLVIAGQGHIRNEDPDVTVFGHATIPERAALMSGAVAVLAPTRFREPFGGVAVEAQLCGAPAITTDQGAFCETVDPLWRCASHGEFVEACYRALRLNPEDRALIKRQAEARFSLEAIAPQYERFFQRLTNYWGEGWYARAPVSMG